MSESEYERLYQEFVRRGGGQYTLDGTNKTPLEYYETVGDNGLTPEEEARLTAQEEQYNRSKALMTILDEIEANTFTNPFVGITEVGKDAYAKLSSDPVVEAIEILADVINGHTDKDAILDYFEDNGYGTDWLSTPTLDEIVEEMYDRVLEHTDDQVSDLPAKLDEVSSAVAMATQFDDTVNSLNTQSCNLFNELMGLLAGAFDGMFDFIKDAVNPILDLLRPFLDKINEMASAITGAITDILSALDSILAPIKDAFARAMSAVNNLIGKVKGFVDDIFSQINSEVAGLINMANELLNRAKALALAAAAFDICQLAVLLRTGSNNLTDAITALTSPLPTPAPAVPVETDPRADPDVVSSSISSARRDAAVAPGVPQSPLRHVARPYDPISAYLLTLATDVSSALSGAISSALSVAGVTTTTSGVTTTTTSSNATSDTAASEPVSVVRSKAFEKFTMEYINRFLQVKNDVRKLRIEIRDEFSRDDVNYSVATVGQSRMYIETLQSLENNIQQRMLNITDQLVYRSEGGHRDEDIEEELNEKYDQLSSTAERTILSAERTENNISLWFDSVKQ